MKKIIVIFCAALILAMSLITSAAAKPCPWRNKHCRPPAATMTITATTAMPATPPPLVVTPVGGGETPVYICQSQNCFTPGKP